MHVFGSQFDEFYEMDTNCGRETGARAIFNYTGREYHFPPYIQAKTDNENFEGNFQIHLIKS